ncbi:MAG: HEAT repeat protein/mono/diheme cytochrome c family protein, partial [Rhodothermales bacterium]
LLQFHSYNWEHRAYWGENRINWGSDKSASRLFHGPVPMPGVWTQLRVRAGDLGFYVGDKLTGLGFARDGGDAVFDEAGIIRANPTRRAAKLDLARLHAIWGLGQLKRVAPLEPLLKSADPEIRAQVARLFGEKGQFSPILVDLLSDPEPRVRFCAAQALPHGHKAGNALIAMLDQNRDVDTYIRYAGARALARGDGWEDLEPRAHHSASAPRYVSPLFRAASHKNAWVRRAAVIGFRQLRSPQIAPLLNDSDSRVALEAARAIYDVPIPEAMPALADLLPRDNLHKFTYERAIHANYRLGQHKNARRLAEFAIHEKRDHTLRADAAELLLKWAKPPLRDIIVGLHRPLPERDPSRISSVIASFVAAGLDPKQPEQVRVRAVRCVGRFLRFEQADAMNALALDPDQPVNIRSAAARALHSLKDPRTGGIVERFINDSNNRLASEGNKLVTALNPATGARVLASRLRHPSISVRQSVVDALGTTDGDAAARVLSIQLDELLAGTLDPALELDLIEACELRKPPATEDVMPSDVRHGEEQQETEKVKEPATSPELVAEIAEKLAEFAASRVKTEDEPLGPWLVAADGGNAKAGENIFFHRQDAQCSRCHLVRGTGAAVGPDLSRVGADQDARTLIESILLPSAQLSKGFDAVPISAMPPIMKDVLNPRDLRDLVAFLKTLKPRNPDPPKDSVAGIDFERFEGDWNTLPDLRHASPIEFGHVADFADAAWRQAKGHAWRFTGYLTAETDDWYTIATESMSSFKIDDQELIGTDPNQPPKKIALLAGSHSFTAIYVGSDEIAEFAPSLNGARIHRGQLIRGITVLEPANPVATSPGLDFRYFNKGANAQDFDKKRPDAVGVVDAPGFSMSGHEGQCAVQLSGYIDVPADGEYAVFVDTINECELRISGETLIDWSATATDQPQNQLLSDFNGRSFGRWQVEGKAFGRAPTKENLPEQQLENAEGGIANSFHGGKAGIGKLISPEFVIRHGYFAFKVGGGKNKAKLGLRLFVNGERVREAAGENGHKLVWRTWAVKEYIGQRAHLEIVDEGDQGFILVDTILNLDKSKRGSAYLRRGRHAFTLRAKRHAEYRDHLMAIRLQPTDGQARTITPLRLGPEPGVEVEHLAPGVHITQFEGKANNKLAEMAKMKPKGVVIGERINLEKRSRDTDFALTLRGYIKIDTPGEYRFWIKSDDGSRFRLNGRDLMVWDGSHGHEPG